MILRGAVGAVLAGFTPPAGAVEPVDPSGTWLTEDGRARIRVERCGTGSNRSAATSSG
jgi:hypothetical protein